MQRSPHPVDGSAPAPPALPAFAITEVAAVVVIAAFLAALVLIAGGDTRRQARLGEDIAKLRQLAAATGAYAADNGDLYWNFSWTKGAMLSQYPDLNQQAQASGQAAASAQGVDILRRLAGREDIMPISGWYPHQNYAYLVLNEYLDAPFPGFAAISSGDERIGTWARDPKGFDAGLYPPNPTGATAPGTNAGKRWPYRSTFMVPAAFSDGSRPSSRVYQAAIHSQYFVPSSATLGARPVSEVAFPAHKVFVHDAQARHFGARKPYCTHDQARLPLLFADGAVSVRAAADSNSGWLSSQPALPSPVPFNYQPDAWEPPTMSGTVNEPVIGRFRWTRGCANDTGLKGRDFDAPEPCPPPP